MSTVPHVIDTKSLSRDDSELPAGADMPLAALTVDAITAQSAILIEHHVRWQKELSAAFRTLPDLLEFLQLTTADLQCILAAAPQTPDFPLLVPRSFAQRMCPGDPQDPLLLQILPNPAEMISTPGFTSDAVGDQAARMSPGLLQKYAGRALLISAAACAIHCRYCFRREYPYQDTPRTLEQWQEPLDLIRADSSLHEVILSGGDPLMLTDGRFAALCRRIDEIPHVERIRIHSRLPIVLPSRVTDALVTTLTSLNAQPIFVVHANHPHEIADDCEEALRRLARSGIPLLNQSVLLRGVNDSVETLEMLCRRLMRIGVMPYYLHQLDQVSGSSHFLVDIDVGRQLVKELACRLPGYGVPRFVREIPGEPHKTPL